MTTSKKIIQILLLILSGIIIRSWFIPTPIKEGYIVTWKDYISIPSFLMISSIIFILISIYRAIKSPSHTGGAWIETPKT